MNPFEAQLQRMMNTEASDYTRYYAVQGFKSFALAHIAALQAAVQELPASDPAHIQAQAALDEITAILMDR